MFLWIGSLLVLAFARQDHIWGESCVGRRRKVYNCSSYLSDGPNDADVQVTLVGLPNSTESSLVHLQWWAARGSLSDYNLLASPIGASWYQRMKDAYPKYWDSDFNGGNVLVSADGEATLTIRSPSLYRCGRSLRMPHIHLRLCYGESSVRRSGASVEFGFSEYYLHTSSSWEGVSIKSASNYTHNSTDNSTDVSESPLPAGTITGCADCTSMSTTTVTAATMIAATTTAATTTAARVSAILTSTTTHTTTTSFLAHRLINSSIDGIDPDGWEFSPVFQCLNDDLLYNYFTANCTEDCPTDVVEVSGQCVRPSVVAGTSLTERWKLEIMCTGDCLGTKINATLHLLRFYAADLFNITYQEITAVTLSGDITSRRLTASRSVQTIYLSITIVTDRVLTELAVQLMHSFISDADTASVLLGMDVVSVEQWNADPAGDIIAGIYMDTDPYSDAYVNLVSSSASETKSETEESALQESFLIIICVAGGVIVLGVAIGVVIGVKRNRKRAVDCKKAEDNTNALDNEVKTDAI